MCVPMAPKVKFYYSTVFCSLILSGNLVYADDVFNPSLLLNTEGGPVADLSSFDQGFQLPGVYDVDIYINDSFIGKKEITFFNTEQSDSLSGGLTPCLSSDWLKAQGIKIQELLSEEELQQNCISLKNYIPEASVIYNFSLKRLSIDVPQIWMDNSRGQGYISPSEWDSGINAGFLNYNLNGSASEDTSNLFVSLSTGINIGRFRFKNNSNYSYLKYHDTDQTFSELKSLRNSIETSIIPIKSELVLGDSFSVSSLFDGFSFRGGRLYSSDAMLPYSMQGYAPVIRGIANGKSIVTVRQNGYRVYQTNVSTGPFEITDLNPLSLSGNLDVTIEGENGNLQNFTVPYSGVPILLREGRTKFDVSTGEYRSGNGFQKKPFFVQGTVSHGLPHGVTLYGGSQVSSDYQSLAIGIGKNMGNFGAFSFDVTTAKTTLSDDNDYKGQSVRFLYSKSLNELGTTFNLLGYRYSTKGFYTLTDSTYKSMSNFQAEEELDEFGNSYYDLSSYYDLNFIKKGRFQVNITQNLGNYGSLSAAADHQTYWNSSKASKNYQIGYAKSFGKVSFSLFGLIQESPNQIFEKSNSINMSISIPLSAFYSSRERLPNEVYSNTSISHETTSGNTISQTAISGNLGEHQQFGYNVSSGYNSDDTTFGSASVVVRSKYGTGGVGVSFTNDAEEKSLNYNYSGGVVLHSGGVTFSQNLGETNILIDANGAKNIRVGNSSNVTTDSRGYAVLPYADQYRVNTVTLDPDSLDSETELLTNAKEVVPMRGAIVRAKFDSRIGKKAIIRATHRGTHVPYGSVIKEEKLNITNIVGPEGLSYLSGLSNQGTLKVTWGQDDDESCIGSYALEDTVDNSIAEIDLRCE